MDEVRLAEEAKLWYSNKIIQDTLNAIKQNNITAVFAENRDIAVEEIMKRIPAKATVTHGGSLTIRELGLIDRLSKGNYNYLRVKGKSSASDSAEIRRAAFYADVYLTSVNAITRDGRLVAIDGYGNRTAAIMFGPSKVIIVAGKNKIVDTLDDALKRIRDFVAPVHARRRNWNVPCTETGKCVNCKKTDRICNKTMIIEYERDQDRTTLVLVDEDLGI